MVERKNDRTSDELLGAPYKLDHSPWVRISNIDVAREGLNCQTFVHEYYEREFGILLPIGLWSKELFWDNEFFRNVEEGEKMERGDIYFFGREKTPAKRLHLAVLHDIDESAGPLFRHANVIDGVVSDWELEKFANHDRYATLRGVKRVVSELFDLTIRKAK